MLEEHARLTEGQDMRPSPAEKPARGQRVLKTSDMIFDPLFPRPSSPEKGRQQAASRETWAPPNPEPALTPSGPTATKLVEDGKDIDLPQSLQSLVDLVGEHLHDKLKLPNGDGGGSVRILFHRRGGARAGLTADGERGGRADLRDSRGR